MKGKKRFTTWDIVQAELKGIAKALKLQAREYKRRLKGLNGEAKRLRRMQEKYVSRETNDIVIENYRKEISELKTFKERMEARAAFKEYIPWVIAALSLGYTIFKK
jgi:ribosomal protein L44E